MHRALGLNNRQGLAVFAVEDVVDIALLLGVGHSLDLDLGFHITRQLPSGISQVQVDIAAAGLVFGNLVWVEFGLLGIRLAGGGKRLLLRADLLLKPLDELFLLGDKRLLGLDGLDVQGKLHGGDGGLIEAPWLICRAVAVIHPLDEVEKAAQRKHGVLRHDLALGMHRNVAELHDVGQLAPGNLVH